MSELYFWTAEKYSKTVIFSIKKAENSEFVDSWFVKTCDEHVIGLDVLMNNLFFSGHVKQNVIGNYVKIPFEWHMSLQFML